MGIEDVGRPQTLSRLSFSSVSGYAECPRRFYLSRIGRLDTASWFVTLMGTAVHHVTEQADRKAAGFEYVRGETTPKSFEKVFRRLVREAEADDLTLKASGKEQAKTSWHGGPGKKGFDWCLEFGPLIVEKWIGWRDENGFKLTALPDGEPSAELQCTVPVGGRKFVAYIDRVFELPGGGLAVVDLKTGSLPRGVDQLETYAYQLRRMFDADVAMAGFWGRVSGTTADDLVFEVRDWHSVPASRDAALDRQVASVALAMESGAFHGNTGSRFCGASCPVFEFCSVVGGPQSEGLPEPVPITVLRDGEVVGAGRRTSGYEFTVTDKGGA